MKLVKCANAPEAIGPYSHAVKIGNCIYTSGQIPVNPATGTVPATIEEQAHQSMKNVKAILECEGYSLNDVVKTIVFISDINDFAKINKVYESYFKEHKPARSCVQVAKLPRNVGLEIEAIAVKE